MDRAGHLRYLIPVLLALPSAGCTYATARLQDFGDIVRLEGNLGLGLQVHVTATELVHVGVGSSRHDSAGWTYGHWETRYQVEDHFPLSYIYTIIDSSKESLHSIDFGEGHEKRFHRCYVLFPGEYSQGTVGKEVIHYFDVEVGFLAAALGLEVGFSIGEFFDFLLGLFKFGSDWDFLDPAGDDKPGFREKRRLWLDQDPKPESIPK